MILAEMENRKAERFYLHKAEDSKRFGFLVGQFFVAEAQAEKADSVCAVGLDGLRGSGKSEIAFGLKSALGSGLIKATI